MSVVSALDLDDPVHYQPRDGGPEDVATDADLGSETALAVDRDPSLTGVGGAARHDSGSGGESVALERHEGGEPCLT